MSSKKKDPPEPMEEKELPAQETEKEAEAWPPKQTMVTPRQEHDLRKQDAGKQGKREDVPRLREPVEQPSEPKECHADGQRIPRQILAMTIRIRIGQLRNPRPHAQHHECQHPPIHQIAAPPQASPPEPRPWIPCGRRSRHNVLVLRHHL